MKKADFIHLQSSAIEDIVEVNLTVDSATVALSTRDRVVAEQVKYLQRAKSKLPHWYTARCVIDGLLFEQSSSEATARAKFDGCEGRLAIDLTCGLGVDSMALSSNFQKVISVEIDSLKTEIARYNFSRLSVDNVEVKACSAENFCTQAVKDGLRADLIYIDPSRVDENGRKVYSLEQSSPNVLNLMPLLRKISDRIVIKLSPLFDIDECFRLFENVKSVDIVSVSGECKEVLISIDTLYDNSQQTVNHIIIDSESVRRYPILRVQCEPNVRPNEICKHYLYIADVAFYKSRCVELYVPQLCDRQCFIFDNYIFTSCQLSDFAGTAYQIIDEVSYNPRKIKVLLAERGINLAIIHLRNFPISQPQLYKTLAIKEGTAAHLVFTTVGETATCFIVKPLNNK